MKMRMIGKQSDPQKQAAEQQEQDDDGFGRFGVSGLAAGFGDWMHMLLDFRSFLEVGGLWTSSCGVWRLDTSAF